MVNKQFSLYDYIRSDVATANDFDEQFSPNLVVVSNLKLLHDKIILPLLEALPGELIITSGFRCPRLNRKVCGVSNSQHLFGQAVDLNYFEKNKKADDILICKIFDLDLTYDQLINEHNSDWVHISFSNIQNRMELLKVK